MRGEAFGRQLKLLQLLESRPAGLEVDEAAQMLGRGRRTVYRDFEVLESVGFPLIAEKNGRNARWRMMPGYRHRLQLSLTWSEVLALSTGSRLMAGLAGTLFHEGAVSALEKIRTTLPKPLADRVRAAEEQMSTSRGGHDYGARGRLMERLVEAIASRRTLIGRYRSRSARGAPATLRRIDPYHLRVTAQNVYLVGYCHRSGMPKTFLVDRFDEVELSQQNFVISSEFRADQFFSAAFGMWSGKPKRVRFVAAPEIAHLFLERKIHHTQVAQRRSDGSVDVSLDVAVGPPLLAYLVGLGPALSRIEPAELRKQILESHSAAIDILREDARPDMTHRRAKTIAQSKGLRR